MPALTQIRQAGFVLELLGDQLQVQSASQLTQQQRAFLKQHKAEIIHSLLEEQRQNFSSAEKDNSHLANITNVTGAINAADHETLLCYLGIIGETDQDMIDEVLTECGSDAQLLAVVLEHADIVIRTHHGDFTGLVQCRACDHLTGNLCMSQHWFMVTDNWRKCPSWRPKNV